MLLNNLLRYIWSQAYVSCVNLGMIVSRFKLSFFHTINTVRLILKCKRSQSMNTILNIYPLYCKHISSQKIFQTR